MLIFIYFTGKMSVNTAFSTVLNISSKTEFYRMQWSTVDRHATTQNTLLSNNTINNTTFKYSIELILYIYQTLIEVIKCDFRAFCGTRRGDNRNMLFRVQAEISNLLKIKSDKRYIYSGVSIGGKIKFFLEEKVRYLVFGGKRFRPIQVLKPTSSKMYS